MFPIVPLEFIFPWAMGLPSCLMPIILYDKLIQSHLGSESKCFGTIGMFSPIGLHDSVGTCSWENGLMWPSYGLY